MEAVFSTAIRNVSPILPALSNCERAAFAIELDTISNAHSNNDPEKREYYELESINNGWTARETERQINSQLYERLLLSNDKEAVMAVARKERIPQMPQEIIKDPMVLEFWGWSVKPPTMKGFGERYHLASCRLLARDG